MPSSWKYFSMETHSKILAVLAIVGLSFLSGALPAHAQKWPEKPIRLIVARHLAASLTTWPDCSVNSFASISDSLLWWTTSRVARQLWPNAH
jgi:hypothetical protein